MKNDFLVAITQLSAEKNLPREVVLEAVESALASAFKREEVQANNVAVKIDPGSGNILVFVRKVAADPDEIEDDREQMPLAEARKFDPNAKLGDTVEYEITPKNAGRIAAQTAKQVVLQRLREAEREVVFEEYAERESDVVSGVIQRVEPRQILVDLGKTEAVMPGSEQVRSEHYRPGQRMKFYVVEVFRANKGPQVVVSRAHKNLVKRLFEMEVPEIFRGTVELHAIAREAGSRTKVAVYAKQEGIDPVGACVGLRGVRIQNIVNELHGERVDVIQWDPDPARFVANALSPAQVLSVRIHEAENTAYVAVPDSQLSLAIGKEGQNARLAAKLTGRRIDIMSRTAAEEQYGPSLQPDIPEPVAVAPRPAPAERPVAAAAPTIESDGTGLEPAAVLAEPAIGIEPERELEPVAEAVEAPVYIAPTPVPAPAGAGGRPQIRFAEDILGAPARERTDRKGDRRRDDEPEVAARPVKKRKQGRRVTVPEDELDLEDEDYSAFGVDPDPEPESESESESE